jgi:sec-independent protein translocase protein TatA
MPFRLGPMEIMLLVLLVFFLFGAKRLPEMGKGIGEGIKNFKKSMKGINNDDDKTEHKA